ncbi:hypothetical protein SS50377_20093 [Spironucleus salmonicida]|uniref:Uncharacterized protein n=1 Tax=Spironucleus salmonicida TaxID=348837 RepID=V6LN67_9EUKA|nr:hypothetical protein SS50377_20093 [Spironucleus salmonicida]|eukprot:EST45151.1 Hypothetical protein SS50377_14722 [Spironucleus salmonicida]
MSSFSSQQDSESSYHVSPARKSKQLTDIKQHAKQDDVFRLIPIIEKGDDQAEIFSKRTKSICAVFTYHFHSIKTDIPEPEVFQELQNFDQKELLDACLRMLNPQQSATLFVQSSLQPLLDVFLPHFTPSILPILLPPTQAVLTFLNLIEIIPPQIMAESDYFIDSGIGVAVGYIAGFDQRITGIEITEKAKQILMNLKNSYAKMLENAKKTGIDFVDADGEALEVGGAKERKQAPTIPEMNNRGRAALAARVLESQCKDKNITLLEQLHKQKKEGMRKLK